MDELDRNLRAYHTGLLKLLRQYGEGKVVLIRSAEVVDVFDTEDQAMEAGYATFGGKSWIVKTIDKADQAGKGGTLRACPT